MCHHLPTSATKHVCRRGTCTSRPPWPPASPTTLSNIVLTTWNQQPRVPDLPLQARRWINKHNAMVSYTCGNLWPQGSTLKEKAPLPSDRRTSNTEHYNYHGTVWSDCHPTDLEKAILALQEQPTILSSPLLERTEIQNINIEFSEACN